MSLRGWQVWRPSRAPGGHPKAAGSFDQALVTAVEQDPRTLDLPTSNWGCAVLAEYQATHGQVSVSAETVRRHLHACGYAIRRPVPFLRSPDPDYAAKVEHLTQYQAAAARGELVLLFEDEVDLALLPGIRSCWTKRGTQRRILTPGVNQKRYGFGAVNPQTGVITHCIRERKNSVSFCALVESIVTTYCPGPTWDGPKVVLVVDNFIIHRSKLTTSVLERYADRLTLCDLPTYAPQLNVIELLWKHLRRRVTHNHLFESVTALVDAVEQFFTTLGQQPMTVRSIIGCTE